MKLGSYGINLGLAFQLMDDLLDFTSSEEKLGKPIGNDLREGKVTLPLIYLLQRCRPEEAEKISRVLDEGGFQSVRLRRSAGNGRALRDAAGGARQGARDSPSRRGVRSTALPDSPYKDALRSLPDFIVDRES